MLKFSFRAKLLLLYAGCALALVFIAFLSGSLYIDKLRRANITESLELAKEHGYALAIEIAKMAADQKAQSLSDPAIKQDLELMMAMTIRHDNDLVYMAVKDAKGDVVTARFNGDKQSIQVMPKTAGVIERLPDGKGGFYEITTGNVAEQDPENITIPLMPADGKPLGKLEMRIASNPAFKQILKNSTSIRNVLITGSVLMLIFLLLVFWVLWRLFSHQLRLQQHNARLDRMAYVGTLASGLAHEIRNPLSAMNVNLEVMREELIETAPTELNGTKERAVELAGRVQREVLQLNSTLSSFLEFALPSKEGRTEFSLRGLAEELIDLHAEEMRQRGITWEISSVSHDDATVEADRRLVHQMLRNILVNAIQMLDCSVKKHIKITIVRNPEDFVEVIVSDTGPGIPPENLAKIFEVFFSTRKGGSGFGLAIAKKIAEEHGGTVTASNNMDALGARISIVLPRKAISESDLAERRMRRFSKPLLN